MGSSWLWSFDGWIYNYLCNQCLLPLTLWVGIPLRWGVLYTTLCDKVCQWLTEGQLIVFWFSPGTPVSSTNKTYRYDITEILLKVALNTIEQTNKLIQHFEQSNCIDWINFYVVTDQDIVFLVLDSYGEMVKIKNSNSRRPGFIEDTINKWLEWGLYQLF